MLDRSPAPMQWAALVLLFLGTGIPTARAAGEDASGKVESLEFLSDHNLIRQDDGDCATVGERFPKVEWMAAPAINAPITHTGGNPSYVRVRVKFLMGDRLPPGTPIMLKGASSEPGLRFFQREVIQRGGRQVAELEALNPLGWPVRKIVASIAWKLVFREAGERREIGLGSTGPHTLFVTRGTPRHPRDPLHAVTATRMERAVAALNRASAKLPADASPPRLVHALMKHCGQYYLPARHYARDAAWEVPESWDAEPKGASCISIVRFAILVCDMLGIEGSVEITAFYCTPDAPFKAVVGGLGDPPLYKTVAGQRWQLFLVDETNTLQGQAGGSGGMNFYEAALAYHHDDRLYYFPGGTDRVYDRPDDVLKVFRTLAWAQWDPDRKDWVVQEVVQTLRADTRGPRSIRLP